MIITCPCNKKKFKIDANLIPATGRELKCGSCGHVWFYNNESKDETSSKTKNEQGQITKRSAVRI